jgi:hypothetical protein
LSWVNAPRNTPSPLLDAEMKMRQEISISVWEEGSLIDNWQDADLFMRFGRG